MSILVLLFAGLQVPSTPTPPRDPPLALTQQWPTPKAELDAEGAWQGIKSVRCDALETSLNGWRIGCRTHGESSTLYAVSDRTGRELVLLHFLYPVAILSTIPLHSHVIVRVVKAIDEDRSITTEYDWLPPQELAASPPR